MFIILNEENKKYFFLLGFAFVYFNKKRTTSLREFPLDFSQEKCKLMGNRDFILVTKQHFLFFVNNLDSLMRQRSIITSRSNRPEVFCKKVVRNFAKFTGKHLCQSPIFNKVAGLRPPTLLKKILWHRCFPVNFAKFLRTPFLQNTYGDCFCTSIYLNSRYSYFDQLHGGVLRTHLIYTLVNVPIIYPFMTEAVII